MSYNILVEGELDYCALAEIACSEEAIGVFPVGGVGDRLGAIGIAILSNGLSGDAAKRLSDLLVLVLSSGATVYDLYSGDRIVLEDLPDLFRRILGVR